MVVVGLEQVAQVPVLFAQSGWWVVLVRFRRLFQPEAQPVGGVSRYGDGPMPSATCRRSCCSWALAACIAPSVVVKA